MESKNKWRDRFYGAWQVLTGRAYAAYYIEVPQNIFWIGEDSGKTFVSSAQCDPNKWEPINE